VCFEQLNVSEHVTAPRGRLREHASDSRLPREDGLRARAAFAAEIRAVYDQASSLRTTRTSFVCMCTGGVEIDCRGPVFALCAAFRSRTSGRGGSTCDRSGCLPGPNVLLRCPPFHENPADASSGVRSCNLLEIELDGSRSIYRSCPGVPWSFSTTRGFATHTLVTHLFGLLKRQHGTGSCFFSAAIEFNPIELVWAHFKKMLAALNRDFKVAELGHVIADILHDLPVSLVGSTTAACTGATSPRSDYLCVL
jgi:hypothetical protein